MPGSIPLIRAVAIRVAILGYMRLLSLEYDPVYGENATRSLFSGDISVFDYDVVIWDPAASLKAYARGRYATSGYYRSLLSFSEHASVKLVADIVRRSTEFDEFVKSGRTLVVIVRPPQECYVDTGKREYSGTGRNRVTTTIVDNVDLHEALPISGESTFLPATGHQINLEGDGPIVSLLRKYRRYLSYEAYVDNPPGTPLATVAGTKRVVASLARDKSGGYLILLPAVKFQKKKKPVQRSGTAGETETNQDAAPQGDSWQDEAALSFQTDLLAAIEQLTSKSVTRPPWAERYRTPQQRELVDQVVKQQARIEAERGKLARLQQEQEAAEARDQLFLGSGRALELEVKAVLEMLGGTLTEPNPGREDWRVSFPEGDAVVEVKGVSKSAAEKQAAQLEKWVSEVMEDSGTPPKGILVVNTWKDVPLADRTQDDFPEQMMPYCKNRNHTLMTGLQLFVMRAKIEQDPEQAAYWRKKILETSGKLAGCEDWKEVIEESEQSTVD